MKIALLFNARPPWPLATSTQHGPDDLFEEYDDPGTVVAIAAALAEFGAVVPIEADARLPFRLANESFDFAFNIAESVGRRCREAHAATVCELLRIPCTHSDPLTLALTLDKMLARRVVSPDVLVAPAVLIPEDEEPDPAFALQYPVIVKPNDEGSSKGIRDDSVASTGEEARRLILRLRALYGCPVLVEEYLPGVEVTLGVVGNGRAARVLGMMEIDPTAATPRFVYSVDVKRAFRDRVRYFIPPRLDATTLAGLERDALAAYRLLGCRDVARLDFRLDIHGRPHFLECNPLPGLNPDSSDMVILSRATVSYRDLIRGIFHHALGRQTVESRSRSHGHGV